MTIQTEQNKQPKPLYNLILHLHPKKLRQDALRYNLTFGLGGMSALLFVMLVFTGLLLKFHYQPNPEKAYNSIINLQKGLLFGKLLHNLHYWSAIMLLWITFLHMLRVLFTGAYRKPRQVNWIFGIILLLLVVLSNFTGYLLPWDQLSYWAVTISTSLLDYIPIAGTYFKNILLGGSEVGTNSLSNFYNLHTGLIPASIVIIMAFHFWKVRRAGGVVFAEDKKESPMVDVQPHLVAREFVVALALIALLMLLSVFFDAPLLERANPSVSPNPAKAPWYFMGLQELLIHFHPFFVIVVFPTAFLLVSFWLSYIKLDDNNQGIWFLSDNGKKSGIYSAISSAVFTIFFILMSDLLPDPEKIIPSISPLITIGFIPFTLVTGTFFLFMRFLVRKFSINRSEYIQSLIILLIISYTVLSITGIFFRGVGMSLMWPWQI